MVVYALENVTDSLIEEITPILDGHRQELQSWKDMPLNPNWDMYKEADKNGQLVWLIARDCGQIVGYSLFLISPNPHYKDFITAIEDIFYVVPDKRGSKIAVNLIKRSEKILKSRHVSVITHHAKFTNTFAQFLEKFGYKQTEVMLSKRIDIEA